MIDTLDLRSFTPADINACTDIYAHHVCHGTASFEEVAPDAAEMGDRFAALVAGGYPVLVADAGDHLAGYAYAGPHKTRSAYRYTVEDSIYIAPDFLRRGVGRLLLGALIAQCRDLGFHQMMAVIGDGANDASVGLHQALGFTMIGRARALGYKLGQWRDVVYMQRELADGRTARSR